MSQQYNIKWRVEDEKELRRVARNFNDKLRRLNKKSPENKNILPQFYNERTGTFESRLTIAGLKDLIQTRQDYKRVLNMLKRFSVKGAETIIEAPGNEYGTRTTRWQRQETARLASLVNKKRQERLDRLGMVEVLSAQGPMGYTLGQMFGMGLASRNQLQPAKAFTKSQTATDLQYKLRSLLNESRTQYFKDQDEILKENYIRTLKQNYHDADIKDVIAKIKGMDHDMFVLMFEAKPDAFEYAYPEPKYIKVDGKRQINPNYEAFVSELKGYWLKDVTFGDLSTAYTATMVNL